MAQGRKLKVAIIGSGNIGTDLMIKVMRHAQHLEMGAMVGVDPASDGLARAQRLGIPGRARDDGGAGGEPVEEFALRTAHKANRLSLDVVTDRLAVVFPALAPGLEDRVVDVHQRDCEGLHKLSLERSALPAP